MLSHLPQLTDDASIIIPSASIIPSNKNLLSIKVANDTINQIKKRIDDIRMLDRTRTIILILPIINNKHWTAYICVDRIKNQSHENNFFFIDPNITNGRDTNMDDKIMEKLKVIFFMSFNNP